MAILFWTGDSSTHFNDDDNWSDPTLLAPANAVAPVAGDSIIFDDKSDGQNNLILVQAHITDQLSTNNLHDITVTKAFTKQIQTNKKKHGVHTSHFASI